MKFIINKIILWFPDGDKKVLEFKPNKINIITGESNTGKSAILQIIDYVFFASHSKISESIINENVAWYGLQFSIQDKQFTIARSALYQGKATYDYYFSSIGNIPKIPSKNNEESSIKVLIEAEFGIDRNIKIPFGGKVIKAGSKVSLRYFLLFSTISEDIITSSEVYFDKQNESRYREALPRIFDLAVGIDDVENIVKKERLQSLKGQLRSLTRKQNIKSSKKTDFLSELDQIIKKSKSYGLIPESLDSESSIAELAEIVTSFKTKSSTDSSSKYDLLKKEEYKISRIIRNLSSLGREYQVYKSSLNGVIDSLKPVQYLEDNNKDLVRTSIFDEILSSLKADLASIKADTKRTVPIDTNVSDLIHEQEQKLNSVKTQLANLPQSATSFESDREKHFFLGELKAKLDLYTRSLSENAFLPTSSLFSEK